MKPRIGLIPGDPSGIGPELIAKLLSDGQVLDQADILLIGDEHVLERGQQQAGLRYDSRRYDSRRCDAGNADWRRDGSVAWHAMHTIKENEVSVAEVTRASGASVLQTLDQALDSATAGTIDAIVFAPLCTVRFV